MGDKTVSVRVRFEGGDQVKAGLQEVGREGTRMLQGIGTASAATGAKLQNAGYQVSDFFVQIAGGTAPSRALAQQLPQLLQGFGLIGVAASVLVAALPSVWAMFGNGEDSAKALQEELDGLRDAVDAYTKASDLAIEPLDKLIKKYGELAQSVRDARVQQAELARGDATRALNSALSGAGPEVGFLGPEERRVDALKAKLAELRANYAAAQSIPTAAIGFDFAQAAADIDNLQGRLERLQGETATAVAAAYGITTDQALQLAESVERVRNSAGQSVAVQIAAAEALSALLVEIYGSADAANEATGGMLDLLNASVVSAADLAAASGGIAGAIGAGADEAARLAQNLASALAYGKIQNTGMSGPDAARFSVMDLNDRPTTGTVASGAGGYFKPVSRGGGGGGGGGADKDQARALALTESLRSETEKYALALDEVNRLKQKGLITDETYNRQIDKLNGKLSETGDLGRQAASAIKGAFSGIFDDPKKALEDLAKQLAQMALMQGLAKLIPGVFGAGGFLGGGGIPGFAAGGRHRGGLRIVGENGPELEATGPSMIYPNAALRSMGGGGNVSVNVQNYSGGDVQQRESRGPNGERTVDIMIGKSLTSGRQDTALRSRFGNKPAPVRR